MRDKAQNQTRMSADPDIAVLDRYNPIFGPSHERKARWGGAHVALVAEILVEKQEFNDWVSA